MMLIEVKFTNEFGEVLILKNTETGQMLFNHSDIHEKSEDFEDISLMSKYVFQEDERKVIAAFTELGMTVSLSRSILALMKSV